VVARPAAQRFLERWRTAYLREFPGAGRYSEFFITGAGPGLVTL
jgi:hypothetical protein